MSNSQKQKRSNRVRYSLKKRNKDRLRLSVFKSSKNLYVQVIDDNESKTICSASSLSTIYTSYCTVYYTVVQLWAATHLD